MEAMLDMHLFANRLDRLETTIEKLVSTILARESNTNTAKTTTDHEPICTDTSPVMETITNLVQTTKSTKDDFYTMYGMLKNDKNNFTKEQLNQRFEEHHIESFRDKRTKLTSWRKTGLALSRQPAEWQKPSLIFDDYYPLLAIRSINV